MPLNVTDRRRTAKSERRSSCRAAGTISRFAATIAALSLPAFALASPLATPVSQKAVLHGHALQFDPKLDADNDRISDTFEKAIVTRDYSDFAYTIAPAKSGSSFLLGMGEINAPIVDIMVALDHAPTDADVAVAKSLGFDVRQRFTTGTYLLHAVGPIPKGIDSLRALANSSIGVTFIQPNLYFHSSLYYSTRQIGARRSWTDFEGVNNNLPLNGTPNIAIAIVDTGIDSSNPDLNGGTVNHVGSKITAWKDEIGQLATNPTTDYYSGPVDLNGHGTFMASVAAGTGYNGGLASGFGYLPVGLHGGLHIADYGSTSVNDISNLFGTVPYDTTAWTVNGLISVRALWTPAVPQSINTFYSLDTAGTRTDGFSVIEGSAGSPTAFEVSVLRNSIGAKYLFGTNIDDTTTVTTGTGTGTTGTTLLVADYNVAAAFQVNTPMSSLGDGFNLMSGVAPESSIVGIKALDDFGFGTTASVVSALEYLQTNHESLNVGVANLSLSRPVKTAFLNIPTSAPPIDTDINAAVLDAVQSGCVIVTAAGNDETIAETGGVPVMGALADSPWAITVGATTSNDSIAEYSQVAGSNQQKPDVVAPGGSNQPSSLGYIIAADTNYDQLTYFQYVPFVIPVTGTTTTTVINQTGVGTDQSLDADGAYETHYQGSKVYHNEYTAMRGTSIAAAHVSGVVALMEQALGIATGGTPATFTVSDVEKIKSILEMTATETGMTSYEPATTVNNQPIFNRGGTRDKAEGFGRVNADAALEAILNRYEIGATATSSFGTVTDAKKCWAATIKLKATRSYTFTVTPATGSDAVYEIYLYSSTPTTSIISTTASIGDPVILASKTSAPPTGSAVLSITPGSASTVLYPVPVTTTSTTGVTSTTDPTLIGDETDYIVVKRISGSGSFTLTSNTTDPAGTTQLATLHGIVTDSTTSQPVAGVTVTLTSPVTVGSTVVGDQQIGSTTTASDGSYTFQTAVSAPYELNVNAEGYIAQTNSSVQSGTLVAGAEYDFSLVPSHIFPLGLQFVSSPYTYGGDTLIGTVLGVVSPKVAVWDATLHAYKLYPTSPTDKFTPGQGYWIRLPAAETVQTPGFLLSNTTDVQIALAQGWNMIGDPFNAVRLESRLSVVIGTAAAVPFATAVSGVNVSNLYGYSQSSNAYSISTELDPYAGYWIYAYQPCTLVVGAPGNDASGT